MSRARARVLLFAVLAVGALFRLQGLNWDAHHHLHPDERFISMVEESLVTPRSIAEYLDSAHSRLNPYNTNHADFVYGTLPMLLTRSVALLLHKQGYHASFLVGRVVSALFDLVSVWLVYRIVRRFAGRPTALTGASLLAFAPLAIQLSHFWAVDTFLTTFSTAALLGAVRLAQGERRWRTALLTGVAAGLAVSCKVTGLALGLPIGAALLLGALQDGLPAASERKRWLAGWALRAAGLAVAAAVTIRLAFPYAFLGKSLLSFRLDPRWFSNLRGFSSLAHSVAAFPPNFQWAGRTILFPLCNIALWGASPFFGFAALAALVWGVFTVWKRPARAMAPLLLHCFFLMGYHGLTMAKSMRYHYPIYPALAALAALFLAALAGGQRARAGRLRRWLPAAAVAGTFLCGLAFTSIYRHEHTRVAASRWIYQNVRPAKLFVNETWDDGLPLPLPGFDPAEYGGPQPNLVGPDNPAKVEEIVKALEGADGVAITSNRGYGSLTRIPDVFPMTRAYYSALFEGRLGFRCVADFTSYPTLGPLSIPDDSSEEAFTVYDHPRVLLFRKTPEFSPGRARAILLAAIPETPPTLNEWERWPRSRQRVTAPLTPPRHAALAGKTAPRAVAPTPVTGSLPAALLWYIALALVGAATFPLAFLLFPRLLDRGFGFARVLGLALATYSLTLCVTLHAVKNDRSTAVLFAVLLAAAGSTAFVFRRGQILAFLRENRRRLLQSEAAFAFGFLFFLAFRILAPEIYSGEKPMDFSILNILVRTETLPASDPWFSGAPLRYYTFGQQGIAWLSQVTGLSTRLTFNLAFAYLGGATLQAAFALLLAWTGRLRAGLMGAILTALLGNLSGLREWLSSPRGKHLPLDWNYFWATSRVIPDTINEYPLWSLIFADLHAHVFAFPLFFLFAACALQLTRAHADPTSRLPERLRGAVLLGFAAAAQVLTNAWDAPLLAGLLVLVPIVLALASGASLTAAGRAVLSGAVAIAATVAFARPVWVTGGIFPGLGRNIAPFPTGIEVVNVFGLFFFLTLGWWLVALSQRAAHGGPLRTIAVVVSAALLVAVALLSPIALCAVGVAAFLAAAVLLVEQPEDRLAFGFAGTAFFLIAFAQRFYIYDRMNTYFKLFLEAWLLLAVASATLVFGQRDRRGAWDSWPAALKMAAGGLFGLGLLTAVVSARGYIVWGRPVPPGVPSTAPTLDGLAYLERLRPGDYKAVTWLCENVHGTPVVLEAHGPSYQEFGRISMYTGLPTVLGWDYHVQQRGNPPEEIARRRTAIELIYSSPSAETAEGLLRRYHVGYVYVGRLERTTYKPEGLAKFDAAREIFPLVYENPEARIYRVAGGDTQDVIVATKETLPPPPETPAAEAVEPEEPPAISAKPLAGKLPFADLKEPHDAAVDEKGRVWVADFGHSRLRLYDASGGYLGGWGGRGQGRYGLRELCGVAAKGDTLYVADTWNGRVLAFTLAGVWKATIAGTFGPRGVAVGPDGRVWVSDTGNHRVVFYDSGLKPVGEAGRKGTGHDELDSPVGIAVSASGAVFVADVGNRRIQVLDPAGTFRTSWPFPGWTSWCEPHLEMDDDGTLYAADPTGEAVLSLDASGRVTRRFLADAAGRKFSRPSGLALNRKTRTLYVVNAAANDVAVLKLPERKKP